MKEITSENKLKEVLCELIDDSNISPMDVARKLDWTKSKIYRVLKQNEDGNTNKSSTLNISDTIKVVNALGCSISIKKKKGVKIWLVLMNRIP